MRTFIVSFFITILISSCAKNEITPSANLTGEWKGISINSSSGQNDDGLILGDITFTADTFTFQGYNFKYSEIGNSIFAEGFTTFTYSLIGDQLTLKIAFKRTYNVAPSIYNPHPFTINGTLYTLTYTKK